MPEMGESQAVEAAEPAQAQSAEQQAAHEEVAALAVSVDDFSALEERVHRTVDLVKREREARKAAESARRGRGAGAGAVAEGGGTCRAS